VIRVSDGNVVFGAVSGLDPGGSLEIVVGLADGRIRELHQRTKSHVDIDFVVRYD
jgi:hypothetical protein